MCRTVSTLIYGFSTKATSLCAASLAWKTLKPTLLALNLIESRRRLGNLSATSTRVADVPVECWELIKQALGSIAMKDAEESIVWEYRVGHLSLESWDDQREFYGFSNLSECDFCWREFSENGGMLDLLKKKQKDIDTLLSDFRVSRASRTPLAEGNIVEYDLEATVPVSVPLSTPSSSSFPSAINTAAHQWGTSSMSSFDYTTAITSLTSTQADEAKKRFRNLALTFPPLLLDSKSDVSQVAASPFPSSSTNADQGDDQDDAAVTQKKDKKTTYRRVKFEKVNRGGETAEPRWLLLSQTTDCSA